MFHNGRATTPRTTVCVVRAIECGVVVKDTVSLPDSIRVTAASRPTSREGAVAAAMGAGVDVDCGSAYESDVVAAINASRLAWADVDAALARSFRVLFRLGLFDAAAANPYRDGATNWSAVVNAPAHQALALEAAKQSLVLLKNGNGDDDGDGATDDDALTGGGADGDGGGAAVASSSPSPPPLPWEVLLGGGSGGPVKLALLGPHADATVAMLGDYHGSAPYYSSPRDALAARLAARADGSALAVAPGCADVACASVSAADAAAAAAAVDGADAVVVLGLEPPRDSYSVVVETPTRYAPRHRDRSSSCSGSSRATRTRRGSRARWSTARASRCRARRPSSSRTPGGVESE